MLFPPLLIAGLLLAALVSLTWPWLKVQETRGKALVCCIVAFCLSTALYLAVGAPFAVEAIHAAQETQAGWKAQIATLNQKEKKSVEEYTKLGLLYMNLEEYALASETFRQAVLDSNGNPMLIFVYAKAQMMAADGAITEEARTAFLMANKLMPENPEPLFYLALERMQSGDKKGAKALFTALLPKLPVDSPMRSMVEAQLNKF